MKERLLRAGVPEDRASELQEQYEAMSAEEQRSQDELLAGISDSDVRAWAERPNDEAEQPVVEEGTPDEDAAELEARIAREAEEEKAQLDAAEAEAAAQARRSSGGR